MPTAPIHVPLLDLQAQHVTIAAEIAAALDAVVQSQRFVLGPNVAALEEEIASACRAPHAVGVASGSDALLLALMAPAVTALRQAFQGCRPSISQLTMMRTSICGLNAPNTSS